MTRTTPARSWRTLAVQVGLLAGLGLAFLGGPAVQPALAAPFCVQEGTCTIVKPLFLFIVDYSTSMNAMFDAGSTRWQAAQSALVATIDAQNGFLQGHVVLGLMRFGHDANTGMMGTTINGDISTPKIVDGQALDVKFYDEMDPDKKYYECNGEAFKAAVLGLPAPLGGNLVGIGTWTKGALDRA